jgi:hypothetical protein
VVLKRPGTFTTVANEAVSVLITVSVGISDHAVVVVIDDEVQYLTKLVS